MECIFRYTDYRQFLRDILTEKRKKAAFFTLRNISLKIGMRSSGHLSMILNGSRNLSETFAVKIAQVLKLGRNEQEYFVALVKFNQAKNHAEKTEHYQRLKKISAPALKWLKKEQHVFYEEWYYSAIRELLAVYEISDHNVKDLAPEIIPSISENQFRKGLRVLVDTGLAHMDSGGVYRRNDALITSGGEKRFYAVQKYNIDTMKLAMEALDKVEKELREISTVTMSIDRKTYTEIIKKLSDFRHDIMEMAAETRSPDQVYQLNIQLFPMSKNKSEKTDLQRVETLSQ